METDKLRLKTCENASIEILKANVYSNRQNVNEKQGIDFYVITV